jgi:hypothetical protein
MPCFLYVVVVKPAEKIVIKLQAESANEAVVTEIEIESAVVE